MSGLEKICDVLGVQRKNLEREIAVFDSQIKLIDTQITGVRAEIARMSEAVFAGKVSDNIIQDTLALEAWKSKLAHNIESLETRKRELIEAKKPKVEQLTAVIVKDDVLQKRLRAEIKVRNDLRDEAETSERLETWINANII